MAEAAPSPPAAMEVAIAPTDTTTAYGPEILAKISVMMDEILKLHEEMRAKDQTIEQLTQQVSALRAQLDTAQAAPSANPTKLPKKTGAIKKSVATPAPARRTLPTASPRQIISSPGPAARRSATQCSAPQLTQLTASQSAAQSASQTDPLPASQASPLPASQAPEIMDDDSNPFTTVSRKKRHRARANSSSGDERSPPSKYIAADSSDSSSDEESSPSARVPPPIMIRDKLKWPRMQKLLQDNDIKYIKAINANDCVKLYLSSVDDYRTITAYLTDLEIPYNCFQLPEDKKLNVVLRGVNEALTEEDIKSELLRKKLPVVNVHRMRKGDKIFPLVSVQLDRTEYARTIFDVKTIGGINVRVENKHRSPTVPQCRRCLQFRHTASYCTVQWKCAFCAGKHPTQECKHIKNKDKKPLCANCGGEHWGTYRGCPKYPRPKTSKEALPKPSPPAAPAPTPRNFPSLPGTSSAKTAAPLTGYAQAVQPKPSIDFQSAIISAITPQLQLLINNAITSALMSSIPTQ